METIYRIAKAELKMMFYSPMAWLILVFFSVQCGLFFTDILAKYVEGQAAGRFYSFLTNDLFSSAYTGLFHKVQTYLFLYIPLLTMGSISREFSSGSIRLLDSSPVTSAQVVLGKFLSMMFFALAMIGVVSLFVIFGAVVVKDFDLPAVLTGLLGLFLLICTYAAIGIFMSSLTSYQVVAAISTLALFSALNWVGSLAQGVEWVRDVTFWLSIRGRCDEFLRGMITSEDTVYFLVLPALFLTLTVMRLEGRRKARSVSSRWGRYLAVCLAAIVIGYISSRPRFMFFHDSTETERLTLTPPSRETMKKIDGPVTITSYANILEENFFWGIPIQYNNDMRNFRQYIRFKPDLRMKYVYYWHRSDDGESFDARFPDKTDMEKAMHLAQVQDMKWRLFLSPEELARQIDLSGEFYRFVRQIRLADGRSTFLRIYDDMQRLPSEKEITAAFKRLAAGAIQVGFTDGHGERDIDRRHDGDYFIFSGDKLFRHSLLNNGFDSRKVTLRDGHQIPDDIDILVIADPGEAFTAAELAEIQRYIDSGRNLIISTEPNRQNIVNPITEPLGIRFAEGRLVNPPGDHAQNLVMASFTPAAAALSPTIRSLLQSNFRVTMPDAAAIEIEDGYGFENEPFLVSGADGWNELQTVDFINDTADFDSSTGEVRGDFPVAAGIWREVNGRTQRILVSGDADCFSNGELSRQRYLVSSGNFSMLTEMFRWLSGGEYPIDVSRSMGRDYLLKMNVDAITPVRWMFVGAVPFILFVCGVIILARRKAK